MSRYRQSSYSRTGYFTQSLPVRGSGQLGAERDPSTVAQQLWNSYAEVASTPLLIIGILLFVAMILIWPIQYFFACVLPAGS